MRIRRGHGLALLLGVVGACGGEKLDPLTANFVAMARTPPPAIFPDLTAGGSAILELNTARQRVVEAYPSGTIWIRDIEFEPGTIEVGRELKTELSSQLSCGDVFPASENTFLVAGSDAKGGSGLKLERWTIDTGVESHLAGSEPTLTATGELVFEAPPELHLVLKSAASPDGRFVMLLSCDASAMTATEVDRRAVHILDTESGTLTKLADDRTLDGLAGALVSSTFEHEDLGFTWSIHNSKAGTWILAPDPEMDGADIAFEVVPRESWEAKGLIHGTESYRIVREFFADPR